ncbi:MAG: indolepyruvate oxidoreductase subunit beta [Thermoplasmatales archaeon]|nr:indolepyruvate oxidoreductase subunit beta [Thermoplasmatales archaeon]MCW6170234.1 indolepyruvate oxidoreductase subunit beta [Thermoplasmatales archaeon]
MQTNIIIAGVGGQGVITAGYLIADTLSSKGQNVVMSEIHGLAQRGGSVTVELRIGDVYSPIIPQGKVDIVMGFEPIEAVRAAYRGHKDTYVLINSEKQVPVSLSMKAMEYPSDDFISRKLLDFKRVVFLDASSMAIEAGSVRAVNTVMIGAALASSILPISLEDLEISLSKRFERKLLDINKKALQLGIEYARNKLESNVKIPEYL